MSTLKSFVNKLFFKKIDIIFIKYIKNCLKIDYFFLFFQINICLSVKGNKDKRRITITYAKIRIEFVTCVDVSMFEQLAQIWTSEDGRQLRAIQFRQQIKNLNESTNDKIYGSNWQRRTYYARHKYQYWRCHNVNSIK